MRSVTRPVACAAACAAFIFAAGCGGGKGEAAREGGAGAPGRPRDGVPALRVPVSALATYLGERREIAAGRTRAANANVRVERSAEREARIDRAIENGTRLLAENRAAEAAAELRAAANTPDLPPERRAEALLPLAQALAASGDADGAAEARRAFDACMKRAVEARREEEAREGFAGLLLGHEITTKEGGDPEQFLDATTRGR